MFSLRIKSNAPKNYKNKGKDYGANANRVERERAGASVPFFVFFFFFFLIVVVVVVVVVVVLQRARICFFRGEESPRSENFCSSPARGWFSFLLSLISLSLCGGISGARVW